MEINVFELAKEMQVFIYMRGGEVKLDHMKAF